MKTLYLSLCLHFFLSMHNYAQEPTNAGIPDANHVLVVYNGNSLVSDSVMQYYVDARGIPDPLNIVRLDNLIDQDITIEGSTHRVKIVQATDIIQDSVNNANNAVEPTRHAWRYYLDYIWEPIHTWISSHNLTSTIRYIVLCKGVPFKIQGAGDWSDASGNLAVDGLLCLLNTQNYETFILESVYPDGKIDNPYFDVDKNYTMEYRFLPDHFTKTWEGHTVKLSYLVSHLDGVSYNIVKDIIDRSVDADTTGDDWWILDGDPDQYHFPVARDKLIELGENVIFDSSDEWIIENDGPVIGYVSNGVHAEDNNPNWNNPTWWVDTLNFQYANGAIAITYESFNGNSLTTLEWRAGHGLITQFTQRNLNNSGGTGFSGNAWEPGSGHVTTPDIYFPTYAVGYNQIDAAYLGTPKIAWQNVFMGDPLTRIYICENVFTFNSTIGSGDYTCDLIVEEGVTLTISNSSTINFGRNAKLLVYGTLELESGVILNFDLYSRLYLEGDLTMTGSSAYIYFNDKSSFRANNISVNNSLEITFNDNSEFYINEDGTLTTHPDNLFVFNDNSIFYSNGRLIANAGNSLNFFNNSQIRVNNKIYVNPGAEVNFNNNSKIIVNGTCISQGDPENNVEFNFSAIPSPQFTILSSDTVLIDFTVFNYNGIFIDFSSQLDPVKQFSITNSSFESAIYPIDLRARFVSFETPVLISDCNISNCSGIALSIAQIPEILIEHNIIELNTYSLPLTHKGFVIKNNGNVNINDCIVTTNIGTIYEPNGVGLESSINQEDDLEINEEIATEITISQCSFLRLETGILIDNQVAPYEAVNLYANHFDSCYTAIAIDDFTDYSPVISENIVYGLTSGDSETGLMLTNGEQAFVTNNSITNFQTGIYLSSVISPSIVNNFISAVDLSVNQSPGIFMESCNGQIRKNTIQYHNYGIELGGSSPNVAENTITGNLKYGLYASSDSHPDLGLTLIGPVEYPLTGYNSIYENGICDRSPNPEIYLNKSTIDLESGCNTIADDREDIPLQCIFLYLIDGIGVEEEINAVKNYWGNHPVYGNDPTGRFGSGVSVDYSHFLVGPCTYSQGEEMILMAGSDGIVYDTVYSSGTAPSELTDLQSRYATANEYYYNQQYSEAKNEYMGIVQSYSEERSSLKAYNKLLTIEKQMNISPESFQSLKTFYLQQASSLTDSIMISTLIHLSNLCLVAAGEYETAIDNFDQIVQQNQNTDIALYREIDALTTALLVSSDSTLGKQAAGKYYVSGMDDYNDKVRNLLRNRNNSGAGNEEESIPTEYTLYQNYPNPFNPTTTIKYDLPKSGNVELVIYDILGRKVNTLVNETKEAGRYEISWNASTVASGVYFYQLRSENFMSTKKMLLLK